MGQSENPWVFPKTPKTFTVGRGQGVGQPTTFGPQMMRCLDLGEVRQLEPWLLWQRKGEISPSGPINHKGMLVPLPSLWLVDASPL